MLQHFLEVVGSAVASGFRAEIAAAIGQALAGQHAVFPGPLDALILAVQIADLPAGHADIAGGDVHIRADVAIQLGHKGLAEAHDLSVAAAPGVKVAAALGAADGQAGQAVFEEGWKRRPPL